MPARQPEPALSVVEGPALRSPTPWPLLVTSYFLLLVGSHQDDTFPAMAKRPWTLFPSSSDLIAGVRSDLAIISHRSSYDEA